MRDISNKIEKIINSLRAVTFRFFQNLQSQSRYLRQVASKSKYDIFWISLVLISIFSTWSTIIIPGSGPTNFLLRLLTAVGVLLGGVGANMLTSRIEMIFVKPRQSQTRDVPQQDEQISNANYAPPKDSDSFLHIRQRRFSTTLIILIFLSTIAAVFQWRYAQQNAYKAQIAADRAQKQTEIAQEQRIQADRLSSVNREIVDMLIENISDPVTQGEKLSTIGDIIIGPRK